MKFNLLLYIFLIFCFLLISSTLGFKIENNNINNNNNGGTVVDINESSNIDSDSFSLGVDKEIISSNPKISSVNSQSLSAMVQQIYENFPRVDFQGNSINNTFQLNNSSYYQSVILTGLPFDIIIILTLGLTMISVLGFIIINIVHCILNRNPWRKTKKSRVEKSSISILKSEERIRGAPLTTQNEVHTKRLKQIIAMVSSIVLMVGISVLLISNIYINNDLDSAVLLSIDNLSQNLENRVYVEDRIIYESKQLSFYRYLPYDALEVINETKELRNSTVEIQQQVHHYEEIRYKYVFSITIVLFGIMAMGIISVALRFKNLVILFVGLGLMTSATIWSIPATHIPLGVVISDLCPQMNSIVDEAIPATVDKSYINFFVNCTDQHAFDFINLLLDKSIDSYQSKLDYAKNHHLSNNTINSLEKKIGELIDLSNSTTDFLNCTITSNVFQSTKNIVCVNILNSSFLLNIVNILVGLLLLICMVSVIAVYSTTISLEKHKKLYNIIYKIDDDDDEDDNHDYEEKLFYEENRPLLLNINVDDDLQSSSSSSMNSYHDEVDIISSVSSSIN
ncbi:hypothetical protein DLAC_04522 [Tieghemostelium lacteum]|uniref:Uncharacterized protein n=1 Tax=Tieghemostelium lacteum TaxID=361077 RepID=A0A151ZJQ2_TIELA|nr:hypothetical protein DLAC_04522 [Tieghemostelium lacteum]|eukprot:KYQ94228.1 hypothetical protein DLAC_04522 [Tieghemostelium lacteum]